jgi:4-amino-4-deoxy-L-arabinose transferase-like glycosyltransferase
MSDAKILPEPASRHLLYTAVWAAFFVIYIFAGTVGHDPWWKLGETYGFGIIYHFYTTHTWLIPVDAGVPFMEKPPLYYWTSALLCRILGGILPPHDAARFASVIYVAIATLFTCKAALALLGEQDGQRKTGPLTFLLFLGIYGLVRHSHALVTDNALLAGTAIAVYGMAALCTAPQRWKRAGFWLGIGVGIAFLSKGLVMPGVLGIAGILTFCALPQLRTRYTAFALLLAFAMAVPFLFIWPVLVYRESPALFMEWFWENNIGRFLGFTVEKLGAANRPFYFLWMAPAFAFPVFPLACVQAVLGRRDWRSAAYILPLALSFTGMAVLLISASGRAPYLLPLLPGFTLLAVQALPRIPSLFFLAWNRVAQVIFGIGIALTWLVWWSISHPPDHRPLAWLPVLFDKHVPSDITGLSVSPSAFAAASFVTLMWLTSLVWEKRGALDTVRIWFAGAATLWCVIQLLLMPWINETRSFRTQLTHFTEFMKQPAYAGKCVGSNALGENIPPMLQYFTGANMPLTRLNWNTTTCPLILTFMDKDAELVQDKRWHIVWRGTHLRDIRNMELRLYERNR